jgi:outer membrane immunogenic protein
MTARAALRRTIYALPFAMMLAAGSANAADLSPRYAPSPSAYTAPQLVYSWTGLYAGFNAGYATSGDDAFNNLVGTSGGKVKGAVGGVQIGYNYQLSPIFVVGIENDFEGGDIKNHDALTSAAVSVPWYMTGRARRHHDDGFAASILRHCRSRHRRAKGRLDQQDEDGLDRRRRCRVGISAQMVRQSRISLH